MGSLKIEESHLFSHPANLFKSGPPAVYLNLFAPIWIGEKNGNTFLEVNTFVVCGGNA